MKGYGLGDTIKNIVALIYTKIMWKNARLVRLPILARNRSNIHYDIGFTCGVNCRLNPGASGNICIGKNFVMGDQCQIEAMKSVTIGDNVLIASKVYIGDATHGRYKGGEKQSEPTISPHKREVIAEPITIGNNIWIGNNVTILGGVSIGSGSVIGANAVVVKDIPENCIAVGCPARIVKRYDEQDKIWNRL